MILRLRGICFLEILNELCEDFLNIVVEFCNSYLWFVHMEGG